MKFIVRKEDLFNGIKIVERATSQKAVQPVLYNILIETLENNQIRLTATDLVLTVITTVDAQIEQAGKITLPARKLNEVVSDHYVMFSDVVFGRKNNSNDEERFWTIRNYEYLKYFDLDGIVVAIRITPLLKGD